MHYAALVIPLLAIGLLPVAFGEIVETKGQNYDLVENFFIGEAVWESHPERIMDGGWQNYALTNTADKVIFNTNAVGSFIFDKNSCSYSIYGNGFSGEQIIPSVSAVATYLNNGQWQNLPINDESCIVEVSEYEDGVFLTSTKVITEDITEDVFISYTGTTQNFYVNATNSQFTLVTNSTGNVGYFNGETRVLESVEVEKFVQELRLDINSGFKETFKVWHDGSEELGISQTVHTGESITIGETVIDIAQLNGQSFDRQYIIDNEAEILAITDSVNYDFDTGIESLSNVNIIFDGDYKVNMDYASGITGVAESTPFIGYLEIDPSFTTTATSNSYASSASFDVSSLPTPIAVSSATAGHETLTSSQISSLESSSGSGSYSHTWTNSPQYTSTSAWSNFAMGYSGWSTTFLTDIHDSDLTTFGHFPCYPCGTSSAVFDTGAKADQSLFIKNALVVYSDNGSPNLTISTSDSQNSGYTTHTTRDFGGSGYAVQGLEVTEIDGNFRYIKFNLDNTGYDSTWRVYWMGSSDISNTPELSLTYEIPIAPQPPTGLTTVTGIPLELDWDSPATTTTTTTPYISSTIKSGYGNPSFSGSDTLGYVAYANPWVYSTGYFFDVSTIPSGATITDVDIKYDVTLTTGASESCEVNPMTTTSSSSNSAIFTDSQDGTAFVDNSTWCNVGNGNDFTLDLGSSADTDLQNRSGDEWGIGMSLTNLTPSSNSQRVITGVELQVSYTSTNSGDGGSPITGYKVFRTLNEFAQTELPNNSANANGVDFTDNEFLIHGFEDVQVRDSTLDGTNTGATSATGLIGNAYDLDGSSDLAVAGGTVDDWKYLTDGSDWTYNGWYKFDSFASSLGSNLFQTSDGGSSTNTSTWAYVTPTGDIVAGMLRSVASSYVFTNQDTGANIPTATGQWNMVTIAHTSGTINVYVNGVLGGTITSTGNAYSSATNPYTPQFGGDINTGVTWSYHHDGQIDEITFYKDKTLSASEITTLYNSGNGDSTPDTDSLFVHYDFDSTTTLENQKTNTVNSLADKSTNSIFSSSPDARVFNTVSQSQYNDGSALCDGCGHGALVASTINAGSALDGMQVAEYSAWLYTGGGTPNGVITASIGENTGATANEGLTTCTIGTIDTSTITLTSTPTKFTFSGNTCTIDESAGTDWIGLTTTSTVWIGVKKQNTDVYDGTNTQFVEGNFNYVVANDMAFELKDVVSGSIIGSSTTGVIGQGVQNPDLSFTDSNLPDNTDDFSIGSWVKLDESVGTTTSTGSYTWDGAVAQDDNNKQGFHIATTSSVLYDKTIDSVSFWLKKTGSPTGDAYVRVWSNANIGGTGTQVHEFGSIDTATLTTSYQKFTFDTGSHTLSQYDTVGVEYSGTYTNAPVTQGATSDEYDGTDTIRGRTTTSGLSPYSGHDIKFEITETLPPTNTKLLQLNDVTFSVNPTSASVDNIVSPAWDSASAVGFTINGATVTPTHTVIGNNNWIRTTDSFSISNGISFPYSLGGTSSPNTNQYFGISKETSAPSSGGLSNEMDFSIYHDGSGLMVIENGVAYNNWAVLGTWSITDNFSIDVSSSGVVNYMKNGVSFHTSTFTASGDYYVMASNYRFGDITNEYQTGGVIVSATGLDDNTSSPQHYTFTRDGNDWEIYQNGVSEATATDSISLGSNENSYSDSFTSDNWIDNDSTKVGVSSNALQVTLDRDGSIDSSVYDLGTVADNWTLQMKLNFATLGGVDDMGFFGMSTTDESASQNTNGEFIGLVVNDGGLDNRINMCVSYMGNGCGLSQQTFTFSTGTDYYYQLVKTGNSITQTLTTNSDFTGGTSQTQTTSVTGLQYIKVSNLEAGNNDGSTATLTVDDVYWQGGGKDYTTNISGMIDEYFIDSTALTSTEIDQVYENGKELTPIATTNAVTTDYDDSSVVGGNDYYYSVKATNAIGDSDFLTPFVNGLAGTPPGVPTGVSTAINNANTAPLDITVSWSAPTNVGSGTLTGFEIYRDGVLVDTVGLVSSVPNTVPSGGGTFVYSMKAVSTHGTSGLSGTSSITTPSVPDAPAAPTGSINDPNGSPLDVTVSWVAPNAGGSAITNYDLYRSSTSGSGFTIVQAGVTGLTHTDTTPSAGTWYYTVAANNLIGSSAQSPELSVSTPSVPSAISDLAGSTVSDTAINLTWSAPNNGGSNIIDYSVYRDGVSIDTVTTPGYSDTGLTQQTSYTYTVYARNNVGTSLISNSVSQETHGVPAVVPSFQATSAALDAITLSWGVPNDYNSAITNYVIERESPIGGGFQPLATVGTVTTYSDTELIAVTEYNYRIKAVNAYGNSPTTTASTITLPAPPTNVFVTPSSSTTELTISWDEPTLTTGITGYQLQREIGIGNGFTAVTTTSGTSHLDTGLTTNIFYNYRLVSVSVQGNSDYSNTYAQTTFHLPDPVTVLSATAGTVADVTLDWDAPAIPYAAILGYTIYNVDAPGTTASATATLSTTLDQVSSITINDGGTQYSVAPTVTISAPTGQLPHVTATATAAITNGVVTSVSITNNGDGYNTIPTITLTSPSVNTAVSGSSTLTPYIVDTGDITTSRTITGLEPSATHNFAIAPITIHGSSIQNAAIVSISPDVSFEGIVIDMPDEINPSGNVIQFMKTQVGNNTNLTLEYDAALDITCETTNPFSATTNTYPNLAETSLGNGKVTHTIAFNDSQNNIVDVMCYDVNDPTIKGQQRIQQNVIPLKDQMDDFNSNTFGTGSSFAAIDLMTLIVVIVGMIGFNRKNPAVGLALMAGLIGILSYFQVITLETSVISGFTLVVFLAIAMGLKRS